MGIALYAAFGSLSNYGGLCPMGLLGDAEFRLAIAWQ